MSQYKRLENLLKNGKTVLVEVAIKNLSNELGFKYRLVTKKSCEYVHMHTDVRDFTRSCYIYSTEKLNPRIILKKMKRYDKEMNEYIVSMKVV